MSRHYQIFYHNIEENLVSVYIYFPGLASAYAEMASYPLGCRPDLPREREPPYTTWKIREEAEECHTIDYIYYSKNAFSVEAGLLFPSEREIGPARLPSYSYPSDHMSLMCDLRLSKED